MLKQFLAYLRYLKPVRVQFVLALLAGMVAAAASGFGFPVMIAKVFPVVFDNSQLPDEVRAYFINWVAPENLNTVLLIGVCALLPLVFFVRGLGTFFNVYFISIVSMKVLEGIRLDAFTRLQILPLAFMERQQRGDLISRLINDAANVQHGLIVASNDIIKQPLTLIAALGFLIYQVFVNPHTAIVLVNLGFIALAIWPIRFFGKRLMKKSKLAQDQLGKITAAAQENLNSQREIRSYSMQEQQLGLFHELQNRFLSINLKMVKYRHFLVPVLEIVTALGLGMLLVRGYHVHMTSAEFTAMAAALFMCYDPLKRLGVTLTNLKTAHASLERINYILNEPATITDPDNPTPIEKVSGRIDYQNAYFSYDGIRPVLNNLTVTIQPGEVVGLVGPSGAGKTTFASMIPRFYDVEKGSVCIDGINVKEASLHDVRKNIAVVSQHPVLFRGTIMDNIRMGRPEANDDEVIRAAQAAAADTFILQMPDGYQTMLGEGGSGLSGGQRQRVAIARAFLKDAPILILDEATASLDAESEAQIQKELDKLVVGRTAFIVAHRFSSIRVATRILVFEDGRIVGDGAHEELYHSCPLYRELYDRQSL